MTGYQDRLGDELTAAELPPHEDCSACDDWSNAWEYTCTCELRHEIDRLRAEVARLGSFLHPIGTAMQKPVRGE